MMPFIISAPRDLVRLLPSSVSITPGQIAFDHDLGAELLGQRPGEAQDTRLGRSIGMLAHRGGDAAAQRVERDMLAMRPPRLLLQHDRAVAWM